jgi:hypothetical protein
VCMCVRVCVCVCACVQPPKNRSDRRGRVVHKSSTYDPRPSNPHRRDDLRHELKEGHSKARLVRFREARAMGPSAATHGAPGAGIAGTASAGEASGDTTSASASTTGEEDGEGAVGDDDTGESEARARAKRGRSSHGGGGGVDSAGDEIRILDIVDLVAEDRAKTAGSKCVPG